MARYIVAQLRLTYDKTTQANGNGHRGSTLPSGSRRQRRLTLALLVGGEAHHGAAAPRAPRDRGADGGETGGGGVAPSASSSSSTARLLQVTTSPTSGPSAAPTAPGGQHRGRPAPPADAAPDSA